MKTLLRRTPLIGRFFDDRSLEGWRRQHPFDLEFGVETSGYRSARQLRGGRPSDDHNTGYAACQPSVIRRAIEMVPDHEKLAFIDLGCGKGRALVVASEFPFRTITGVELSAELCDMAKTNAAIIARRFPDRRGIAVVEGDAVAYPMPTGPVALFLYHPFHTELMTRLLSNLELAFRTEPRAIYVIYCNPVCASIFDESPLFRRHAVATLDFTSVERDFAPGNAESFVVWIADRKD